MDSYKLLVEINKQAAKADKVINCLLQIHIAEEETKFGFSFDECREVFHKEDWKELQNIRLCGLMGMATNTDDRKQIKKEFCSLSEFFKEVKQQWFTDMVIGMVNDKDIRGVLGLLPKEAEYYFTKASVKRALPEKELAELAQEAGLKGSCYEDVPTAVKAAQQKSLPEDFIFIGGSSFIVADLLANRDTLNFH